MAAFGATGADFGRTKKSQKYARTRETGEDADDLPTSHGPSPAAAAFLAGLRDELLPLRSSCAPPKSFSTSASKRPAVSPRMAPPVPNTKDLHHDDSGSALDKLPGKRFLSKAERRKEKKKKLKQQDLTGLGQSCVPQAA